MDETTAQADFLAICKQCHEYAGVLVNVCDGAHERDNQGFSKAHVTIGRVLAWTPPEVWTVPLLRDGLACLQRYSNTQLRGTHDTLSGWLKAEHAWEAEKLAFAAPRHIRPMLGIEKTTTGEEAIVLHSLGHGDPAHEKALKKALKGIGAKYDDHLGTFRLPAYSSITTEAAAELKAILAMVDPKPEAVARIEALASRATPTTMFVRVDPGDPNTLCVHTPYDAEMLNAFKAAIGNSRKIFSAQGSTHWKVQLSPTDSATFRAWAENYHLTLTAGVPEFIERVEHTVPVVEPPKRRLELEDGKIAVMLDGYNPLLNAWLKKNCESARFASDANKARPRYLIPLEQSHVLLALEQGIEGVVKPYVISSDIRIRLEAEAESHAKREALKPVIAKAATALESDYEGRPGLTGTPRPFQRAAQAYAQATMAPNHGLLIGDEMGLGKTIEAICCLHDRGDEAFPALITCPASVGRNWRREIAKWMPMRTVQLIEGKCPVTPGSADVYIISHGMLHERLADLLRLKVQSIVFDEIHNFQNRKSQRGAAGMALAALTPWRFGLDGTPIRNRNENLIHPLDMLGRLNDLGGFWPYVRKYCYAHTDSGGHWNFKTDSNSDELNRRLRETCMIRRLKADVATELPPKVFSDIELDISNRAEYNTALRNLYTYLLISENKSHDEARRADSSGHLAQFNYLRMAAGRGIIKGALEWVENFRDEAPEAKLVVYGYHHEVLDSFSATDPNFLKIDGATPVKRRDDIVQLFQTDPKYKVLGISDAGGVGITLTAASHILITEPTWTSTDQDQVIDRIHRIGQEATSVIVYRVKAPNTIFDDLYAINAQKASSIAAAMDGRESTAISKDDDGILKAMIRLYTTRATEDEAKKKGKSVSALEPVEVSADATVTEEPAFALVSP